MKTISTLLFILFLSLVGFSQNKNYDEALAKKLGADEYGMKNYVLVILKTGSNTRTDKKYTDSCFASHMQNITKVSNEGKLIVAGPISTNDKSYRGIFIFNVKTFDEANRLMEPDAAVKEKLLEPEFYKWYGSAALTEYLPAHKKIEKKSH